MKFIYKREFSNIVLVEMLSPLGRKARPSRREECQQCLQITIIAMSVCLGICVLLSYYSYFQLGLDQYSGESKLFIKNSAAILPSIPVISEAVVKIEVLLTPYIPFQCLCMCCLCLCLLFRSH